MPDLGNAPLRHRISEAFHDCMGCTRDGCPDWCWESVQCDLDDAIDCMREGFKSKCRKGEDDGNHRDDRTGEARAQRAAPDVSAGHCGPVTAHKGKPLYACYEHGRCVAVGTAQEVADAAGVKRSAVLCGVTPSRGGRHARRQYFRFYEEDGR